MRLALCVDGCGASLQTGKVYEVSAGFTCEGASYVDVPSAPNWHARSQVCKLCGHDIQTTWFARRFIPINDADVKDDVKHDQEITA